MSHYFDPLPLTCCDEGNNPPNSGDFYSGNFESFRYNAPPDSYYKSTNDIKGCTDSSAINYNQFATTDNGTCYYSVVGRGDN